MSSSNIHLRNPREFIFQQPLIDALETASLQTQLLIKGQGVFIFELAKIPTDAFETKIVFNDYSNKIALEVNIKKNALRVFLNK
ncbi:MAG: hypothetical protein ACRCYO_02550, partial [Bacteroidia bacterium]